MRPSDLLTGVPLSDEEASELHALVDELTVIEAQARYDEQIGDIACALRDPETRRVTSELGLVNIDAARADYEAWAQGTIISADLKPGEVRLTMHADGTWSTQKGPDLPLK